MREELRNPWPRTVRTLLDIQESPRQSQCSCLLRQYPTNPTNWSYPHGLGVRHLLCKPGELSSSSRSHEGSQPGERSPETQLQVQVLLLKRVGPGLLDSSQLLGLGLLDSTLPPSQCSGPH